MPKEKKPLSFDAYMTKKKQDLDASSRAYSPGTLGFSYFSKKGAGNRNNNKAKDKDGKSIVCRHMAMYVMQLSMKNYHDDLSSKESIESIEYFYNNHYDKQNLDLIGREYYFFDYDTFSSMMREILQTLDVGDQKNFLFLNKKHAMAISISKKPNYLVIKFYEPNKSDKHLRLIFSHSFDINHMSLDMFMLPHHIKSYLIKISMLVLIDYKSTLDRNVKIFTSKSQDVIKHLVSYDLADQLSEYFRESGQINLGPLMPLELDEVHELHFALQDNFYRIIEIYFNKILEESISEQSKLRLFSAKNHERTPGLWMAYQAGHDQSITAFVRCVLASTFTDDQKLNLILAKDARGQSGFTIALRQRHYTAITSVLGIVFTQDASHFPELYQQKLVLELIKSVALVEKFVLNRHVKAMIDPVVACAFSVRNPSIVTYFLEGCRDHALLWQYTKKVIKHKITSCKDVGKRHELVAFFAPAIDLPRYTGFWGTLFNSEKTSTRTRIDALRLEAPVIQTAGM